MSVDECWLFCRSVFFASICSWSEAQMLSTCQCICMRNSGFNIPHHSWPLVNHFWKVKRVKIGRCHISWPWKQPTTYREPCIRQQTLLMVCNCSTKRNTTVWRLQQLTALKQREWSMDWNPFTSPVSFGDVTHCHSSVLVAGKSEFLPHTARAQNLWIFYVKLKNKSVLMRRISNLILRKPVFSSCVPSWQIYAGYRRWPPSFAVFWQSNMLGQEITQPVRWPLFWYHRANAVEQSAWTASTTRHHLQTI